MHYLSVEQARELHGLRLVVTAGMPGPWSESAKKIFEYKQIPYKAVAQYLNQENAALVNWVGVRNAPVAVFGSDPPALTWRDIVLLAERLSPIPPLLPQPSEQRAAVLDISNDICGEGGFGWCRRLMLMNRASTMAPVDQHAARIQRGYGLESGAVARTPARIAEILFALSARLRQQKANGSDYFVGTAPSACDIHWACFSLMIRPLRHDQAPMPDMVRQFYGAPDPVIDAALDADLIAHRDRLFSRHFELPLDF